MTSSPGLMMRHHRGHHGFGRAAADGDLALGIERNALRLREFCRDGVAQRFRAPRDRVLVDVAVDCVFGGLLDFSGGGEIRESLREIHGAVLHGQPRHFADHRFREPRCFIAQYASRPGLRQGNACGRAASGGGRGWGHSVPRVLDFFAVLDRAAASG